MITPTKKELWRMLQDKEAENKQLQKELREESSWCKYWEGIVRGHEDAIVISDLAEEME